MKDLDFHKKEIQSTISSLQVLIDKLKALEESFLKQEETLFIISEFANDWEYWQDVDGNYKYVSPSCELITGYSPSDFYQDKNLLKKIIVPADWRKWQDHSHIMGQENSVEPLEFEIRTKDGEPKWIHHVCRTVTNKAGDNMGIRGSNRDISELKALQDELKHVAGHDHLTGLANRSLFLEHLQQRLKDASRGHDMFVVAFIDLDGFKEINDTYGHDAGDHVLKRVAVELKMTLRQDDIIARFGGDEFVGIFKISSKADLATIKDKILNKISTEIQCYKYEITIRFSIGMSIYPLDGVSMDQLLNKADDEMYAMKARHKAQHNKAR
ncbi:MAG: sensor domain-containing diguanylate cyclase [Proteobacteria bacterium]|nr:sensor domain-containing diguanylate cyclase [Pseudomonadota bacterium]MBU1641489.1 sensor domain-containing diguanylate cyclase [Pseudomonadota bacterium]